MTMSIFKTIEGFLTLEEAEVFLSRAKVAEKEKEKTKTKEEGKEIYDAKDCKTKDKNIKKYANR
jgi:hypothetical protein